MTGLMTLEELKYRLGIISPPMTEFLERRKVEIVDDPIDGPSVSESDAANLIEQQKEARAEARRRRAEYDLYVRTKQEEHRQALRAERAAAREAALKRAEKRKAAKLKEIAAAEKETARQHAEEHKARRFGALSFDAWRRKVKS